jgi:His-Xaa-Ser system protein HxsD
MAETKGNLLIDRQQKTVRINVNPKLYPLDVIYSAAYVFLDKAYLLLEGDPNSKVTVELRAKGMEDVEKMGREFMNELLNYVAYKKQSEKSKEIRQMIVQRALITNSSECEVVEKEEDFFSEDYLDDPEGIAIPWDEKYGNKKQPEKRSDKRQSN